MLWVDKYRPQLLAQLDYHAGLSQQLQQIAQSGDFPHILMYGPSGAGKKTRIACFLHEVFGNFHMRVEHRQFNLEKGGKKLTVELTTVSSNYHIELNPSEAGFRDVDVIQDLVKHMAEGNTLSGKPKLLVVHEVER